MNSVGNPVRRPWSIKLLLALGLFVVSPTGVQAQSSACLPATDAAAIRLKGFGVALGSAAEYEKDRALYGMSSLISESEIWVVADPQVCEAAASGLNVHLGESHDRGLYVVRVGDWYVVEDPFDTGGEFSTIAVFGSDWELLDLIGG